MAGVAVDVATFVIVMWVWFTPVSASLIKESIVVEFSLVGIVPAIVVIVAGSSDGVEVGGEGHRVEVSDSPAVSLQVDVTHPNDRARIEFIAHKGESVAARHTPLTAVSP